MTLVFRLLFIFIVLSHAVAAQDYTQTVRGRVVDATTQNALVGATVQLAATDLATTTDTLGRYRLAAVPVGRYQLVISYLGYEQVRLPELLVETGKEVIRNIELPAATTELNEIVVRAERERITHPVSSRTITVEETRRFPATFFDPARLAASYAGVVNANDQANALIIRGNSPASNNWQIAGAEIVNPNHTPNAGTLTDRPTFTGGGVNILSAQMLDNSTLLTGAFPVQYGNALGGILDMNFRDGNNETYEFTGQIGLIGIDLAAEGPFSKNSDASFVANYRYSTIGLLGALGVPLGDEEINFQDVAVNVSLPTQKLGKFTVFGMGGTSENIFIAPRDTSEIEEQKDRFNIEFASKMGAVGITHRVNLGKRLNWNSTVVYSATDNQRTALQLDDEFQDLTLEREDAQLAKWSVFTQWKYNFGQQQLGWGLNFSAQSLTNDAELTNLQETLLPQGSFNYTSDYNLVRPFVFWRTPIGQNFSLNLGLAMSWYNDEAAAPPFAIGEITPPADVLEPRIALNYRANARQNWSLVYSKQSQFRTESFAFPFVRDFLSTTEPGGRSAEPIFNRADHLVLGYRQQLRNNLQVRAEAYWQRLIYDPFELPRFVFIEPNIIVSNDTEGLIERGTNYGLELSLQKYFDQQFYYLLNTSIFSATTEARGGAQFDSPYNANYLLNATFGKEWQREKKKRIAVFGVNARFNYRGGFYVTPIDAARSAEVGYTLYTDELFSNRQADFYKLDVRLYWKRNKQKYSNTLALDIQNVTNRQNVAFNFYDAQQQRVITKYQLGLIPILNYRIEF